MSNVFEILALTNMRFLLLAGVVALVALVVLLVVATRRK